MCQVRSDAEDKVTALCKRKFINCFLERSVSIDMQGTSFVILTCLKKLGLAEKCL